MSAEVLTSALREQRRVLGAWSAAWVALVGLYCASWPAVRDNGTRYDDIVAGLPAALRQVLAGPGGTLALGTPAGYLRAELLSATGPLLAVALGLLLGSRVVAADEARGTLELLLAQPVSRRRVLLEQFAAAGCGILVVFAVLAVALLGLGSLVGLGSVGLRVTAVVVLALLALQGAALGLLVAAATGQLGTARGLAGGVALALFVVQALQTSVPVLADVAWVSPFWLIARADVLTRGVSPALCVQLLLPVVVCTALAVALFDEREIAHP